MIEKAEDIFWLTQDEFERAATSLDRNQTLESLFAIPSRKAIWRAARRAAPPMMLPQMKIFGFDLMQLRSGRPKGAKEYHQGARIIQSWYSKSLDYSPVILYSISVHIGGFNDHSNDLHPSP